ncbi:hypothetical protein BLS_007793 [Venturia inaequalis]|uniref:VOC domain-containing protein n=1 Tax=Venturia inaequalis TaxID=5025 RepID=A0A8H3V4V8_VENIN|nr:hypothetical protein BLS_007793 [Venturia inaequalis]
MTASFSVKSLDHVVLTVKSIEATVKFYSENLGMEHEVFTSPKDSSIERHSLKFGHQKINLHLAGHEFEPKAKTALPGTADLCFITDYPIDEVLKTFKTKGLRILEEGKVVERIGAQGQLRSVYVRDPDGNLIE